jgi:lysophospholipase L1-like esterase
VFGLLLVQLTALVAAAMLFALDYWVLSQRKSSAVDYRGFQTSIETEQQVVERLRQPAIRNERRRLLFVGSSQTWGAGAATATDTFVQRLQQRLDAEPTTASRWQCINTGIPGAVAAGLLHLYEQEWLGTNPSLVLVNLSNNDRDPVRFRQSLERLLELNQQRGIATVLVLEPNSIEAIDRHLPDNHALMASVAAAAGVEVIDMQSRLAAVADRGFLWWDHVHLTSCGQRLFAEVLYAELARLGLL